MMAQCGNTLSKFDAEDILLCTGRWVYRLVAAIEANGDTGSGSKSIATMLTLDGLSRLYERVSVADRHHAKGPQWSIILCTKDVHHYHTKVLQ